MFPSKVNRISLGYIAMELMRQQMRGSDHRQSSIPDNYSPSTIYTVYVDI